jgi:hypothetical protein
VLPAVPSSRQWSTPRDLDVVPLSAKGEWAAVRAVGTGRHGHTHERARGQVDASADGTGLYEFNLHANAWQLEALQWRAAVAERLRGSILEHLADLDAEVVAKAFACIAVLSASSTPTSTSITSTEHPGRITQGRAPAELVYGAAKMEPR